jgi:hypothetical protein
VGHGRGREALQSAQGICMLMQKLPEVGLVLLLRCSFDSGLNFFFRISGTYSISE